MLLSSATYFKKNHGRRLAANEVGVLVRKKHHTVTANKKAARQ